MISVNRSRVEPLSVQVIFKILPKAVGIKTVNVAPSPAYVAASPANVGAVMDQKTHTRKEFL